MIETNQHSILSASSAHRWLECTPSARIEMRESNETSVYAQEGTAAHYLAEIKLGGRFGKFSPEETEKRIQDWHDDSDYGVYYNKEFEEYVDEFVEYVVQQTEGLENYHIYFEFRVDFSHIVPQGFGTADVLIVTNEYVKVIDLKFGQGQSVSALHNPQLRLYGVGAVNLFPLSQKVIMTIHQPRLLNCDTEELTKEELIDWAVNYVKPRAELAIKGEGVFCAKEETCKWCKIRGKCKIRADRQLEEAREEFGRFDNGGGIPEPQILSPEQISDVLTMGPKITNWLKDVTAYALGQLVQGVKIPGYKLVEGKSNRIITDEAKIKDILLNVGLTEDMIMKPAKMQGITELEKICGKKLFASLCKEYLVKPQGKLTLALNDDRRPEVTTGALDFASPVEED